jgi:hypothetical protein
LNGRRIEMASKKHRLEEAFQVLQVLAEART